MKAIMIHQRLLAIVAILVAAVLFVAVNLISSQALRVVSLDLTEDRLYTLSDGTREILAGLDEPIILRFFFSPALGDAAPQYRNYANVVRDILQRYSQLSGGKLRLEFRDPEVFSEEEDQAVSFGLQGVPVNDQGDNVYFGLVGTNTTDGVQTIAFFQPDRERFLEYDLTRLIDGLSNRNKKSVGLINSTLPIDGRNVMQPRAPVGEPWVLFNQIGEQFDLRNLGFQPTSIPADIDVLMIVQPKGLSKQTLYAIDQYVLRGGRLMVFVDPHAESDPAGAGVGARLGGARSDLAELFAAWGVAYDPDKVAADIRHARRVSVGDGRVQPIDYPAWMVLSGDRINRDDVVGADVPNLNFQTAGFLARKDTATIEFTPLAKTSADAMVIDAALVREAIPDIAAILTNYQPGGEELVLAARLSGTVKSAFPDGPPEGDPKDAPAVKEDAPAHLAESAAPVNIIIVADTDLMEDRSWVRSQTFFGQNVVTPIAGNGGFITNGLDNLSGSGALIGLRGRGQSQKPFERIAELQFEAEQRFRAEERELQKKLEEAGSALRDLQTQRDAGGQVILSDTQKEAITKFQAEMLATRRQLRDVQHALRRDIDALESALEFVNIGLIPLLVGAIAIGVGSVRMRRRRRRHHVL